MAVQEALHDGDIAPQDVQVAEVHDCFTIAELLMYEAIGWAEPGSGIDLVLSGRTSLEGEIPVNTGGGLVAFGHPVGATGVKQAAEIYRQMKGLCGDYQLPRALHTGLTVNMGGDDRTVVSLVLENLS
jgi:acetyl-CoA acyltransferase